MDISEYISALRMAGVGLASAAADAGPDAPVPSCPGWVVRDLVRHTGGVHRWATGIVSGPRTTPWNADLDEVVGSWPADGDLLDWFLDGHATLIAALAQADPELDCWTFLTAPSPLAMWARRQAHETAIHRVDAELAAGRGPGQVSAGFGTDGIDELVTCFITRPGGELLADPPRNLRLRCTDTAAGWLMRIGTDRVQTTRNGAGDAAQCVVSGRASDLYLAVWNRQAGGPLTIEGDGSILDLFRNQVRVRWSQGPDGQPGLWWLPVPTRIRDQERKERSCCHPMATCIPSGHGTRPRGRWSNRACGR